MREAVLIVSGIHIQNANALSSTFTIGFPAMTAWLGAVHALQRRLNRQSEFSELRFTKTGVICHGYQLQTHKGTGDWISSIIGTTNPLRKKGNAFVRPPFIEEARIHLLVDLVIEVQKLGPEMGDLLEPMVRENMLTMKIAGGDVLSVDKIEVQRIDRDNESAVVRKLILPLMSGYAVIERRDLMNEDTGEDTLGVLLHYLAVYSTPLVDKEGRVISWQQQRATLGWLVPLAVGFRALSPLQKVKRQRDAEKPHCFVEPLVTLGEFKMLHRLRSLDDLFWHYEYDETQGTYLCKNE
ncbi:type I-F CRISPR-associated protein Csy2 [Megasphaera elsdenii]|uniref:type I-F CRISPR-associated protein Csy2 n=1 Tax=Megasphaera elsdenii TaxID=907 RepID=UPI00352069A1